MASENLKYKYSRINWMKDTLPLGVTTHPLWAFHEALAQNNSTEPNFEEKKFWALASIKSLIEVDLNRQFVIQAGLAYERDVDNGVYTETYPGSGLYQKTPGVKSEFYSFRTATGNAASGDNHKADTLRTSQMIVTPSGRKEFVSFHPSISYPTGNLAPNERQAAKEQQFNYFYNGLFDIWKRINNLEDPASKKSCLTVFCEHIKIDGVGCANERLGTSIDKITQELIQYEEKKVTETQLLNAIQDVVTALSDESQGNPHELFEQLFKKHRGYKIEGEAWVIEEATKKTYAAHIIELGISKLYILDEDEKGNYLAKLEGPQPAEKLQADLKIYQGDFDLLSKQLEELVKDLTEKSKNKKSYQQLASVMTQLSITLNTEMGAFFSNPSAPKFQDCILKCQEAIKQATVESANHRGWHRIDPIIRGILGVFAGIIMIPGILVGATSKEKYIHTFFATPPTQTSKKMAELSNKFEAQKVNFEEQENEVSQQIKGSK